MEDLSKIIRNQKEYKTQREEKYKHDSKFRLSKILKKKVETTMIGALSAIEASFGFLWGHDDDESLSPEQEHMKELYDDLRSEILDKGNSQIRNLESEMAHYEIKWLRYHMNLPLMSMDLKEETTNGED